MAVTTLDDEGGLGILASASAFVSSNRKKLQGETTSRASSEREDEGDDGDENCSQNAAAYKPAVAQIGVDLSAMEYAMSEYLSRTKANMACPRTRYCRLCETCSDSYDQLMEHLITEHRLAVLQSMHDLNLAGILQQSASYRAPAQDCPSLFSAIIDSIREIACTTPTASPGLERYIQKILDDGPTAWIMEHAKRKKQATPEPLYPICPITSRLGPGFVKSSIEMPVATKPGRAPTGAGATQPFTSSRTWSLRNR